MAVLTPCAAPRLHRRLALALAAAAAGAAAASCYAPSLRDCTVSCAGPSDCAGGQVCGTDGMCAAPDVAGHCAAAAPPDASATGNGPHDAGAAHDAGPTDAAAADAPATVRLTVQIQGKGSVVLDGTQSCSALDPQKGNCTYDVPPGVPITAQAAAIQIDMVFTMWMPPTCAGQGARCTFTPTVATTLTARFDHPGK